jgi:hypothetical protein
MGLRILAGRGWLGTSVRFGDFFMVVLCVDFGSNFQALPLSFRTRRGLGGICFEIRPRDPGEVKSEQQIPPGYARSE